MYSILPRKSSHVSHPMTSYRMVETLPDQNEKPDPVSQVNDASDVAGHNFANERSAVKLLKKVEATLFTRLA
jgi:hypothetical protein